MKDDLKNRFNAIAQKIISIEEFDAKAALFVKNELTFPQKALAHGNDVLKFITVGLGEIAKDVFGLPENTGTYEDAQGRFYITGAQVKRMWGGPALAHAFNARLAEGFLRIAEECGDHSAKIQSGELKKFTL